MKNQTLKILIAEDSLDLLKIWTTLFKTFTDYTVRAVSRADTAYQLVEDGYVPDVLISDYFIGDGNGVDLIYRIQKIAPHVIPILVTGNDEDDSIRRLAKKGFIDLLLKPVKFEILHNLIIEKTLPGPVLNSVAQGEGYIK